MLLELPLAVLAIAAGAWAGQRSVLFRAAAFDPVPALWQAERFEVVRYSTDDGLAIAGWYAAPTRPGAPVILYFPGCQGHLGRQSAKLRAFVADGAGVLMAGYRGYARNPGRASEAGLRHDGAAAAAFLRARGVAPSRTVLWGYSLGSSLATGVATGGGFAGLVLEASFLSVPAVVASHAPIGLGPLVRDRFDTRALIPRVDAPVLVLHGTADAVIPWRQGETLSRIAPAGSFVALAGGGHDDLEAFGAGPVVADFVRRMVPAI